MRIYPLLFLLLVPLSSFGTLKTIEAYAQSLDAMQAPSNKNVMYPEYGTYHTQQTPSLWQRLTTKFKIVSPTFWHYDQFKKLLADALTVQQKSGNLGRSLKTIALKQNDSLIVFGDLQGAFHSFTRCLRELANQEIIDEELKLIKKNHYIIFTGNVVSRSPFLLETLHVLLELYLRNPGRVIFLRGLNEDHNNWHRGELTSEINNRAPHADQQTIRQSLDQLFNNLPIALLGKEADGKNLLINSGGLTHEIEELLAQQEPPVKPSEIAVVLEGISERFTYQRSEGLTLRTPQKGATTWSINSSPTQIYRELFDTFFDAFVIIKINKTLEQSTITLHNHDVRKAEPFNRDQSFCLTNGMLIDKEHPDCPTREPIVIGSTLDLSKGLSPQGRLIEFGMALRINQQNLEGGIDGHPIKLVALDDQYNPQHARSNVEKLITEYHANMILAPTGSPTLHAYLDKVKNKVVFVYFPVTGDQSFRNNELTALINFRPSYIKEGSVLMNYAFDSLSGKRFLIMYQRGIDALEGASTIFEKRKTDQVLKTISYERNQTDFKEIVAQIKTFNPSDIFLFTTSIAGMELIRQLGIAYLSNRKVLALSDMSINSFKDFMHNKGISYSYMQIMPPKELTHHGVVKNYLAAIEQYNLPYDPFSLEGYVAATLIINALEVIGAPYTPERVMQALEGNKNIEIDGVALRFNQKTRELAHKTWLIENADTPQEKIVPIDTNGKYLR